MHLIRRKNVGFVFGYESVCAGVLFFFCDAVIKRWEFAATQFPL